ncbi:LysR family transcriptional regulator [Staphylococcus muscae]|uniref:Transcriptional regulator n=1 Tax=Staphylococcus muscae TaxID=1294 RepID=A0A240BS69_9STAP|nr:LysR family transcriptional regulator [Staphylococcus muscae]AVQ34050.1 LysR family transcriptional regulator [Staphylococcus muscae]PNZ05690.1 LysR family transcriptional regulator [Staphylococcus muscae]GGA82152.1 LysR family transcriptional regulator [Staphylococcus muscae]SNV98555.1 transcriptional regulator [Staphylococcus muscae]
MENRVLRYFLTVVSEGNISAAAQLLHVTQPTLSRQLKGLEEELDVTLFKRKGKHMTLTQEGRYLAEQAKNILNLVDATTSNLAKSHDMYGTVTIGLAESRAVISIAKAIKDVQQTYANTRFHIQSGNAQQVLEQLDNGLLDYGVIVEPINKVEYETLSLNDEDVWGVLTQKDGPLAQYESVTATQLVGLPLIVSAQQGTTRMLANKLGLDETSLDIVAQYNLLYNASLLVQEHVGHAVTLDGIINTTGTDLIFLPLKPQITSKLSVIWKRGKPLSTSAQFFLERLKLILSSDV